MQTIKDIARGVWDTIRMDDVKNPKRRKPVCRECEIIGSGALGTASIYVLHVTKMGRIMPYPGITISLVLACAAISLMFSFPPDENVSTPSPSIQNKPSNFQDRGKND